MNSSTAEQNNQDSPARTIPSDNKIVRLAYGFRGQLLGNSNENFSEQDQEQQINQRDNAAIKNEANGESESKKKRCKFNCSKRSIISGTLFCIFIITIIILFFVFESEILGYADDYANFMRDNTAIAIIIFTIAYIIGMAIFISETVFIFSGAYIFGRVFGFGIGFCVFCLIDYFCNQTGCLLAFFNARYLFKGCIQGCIKNSRKLTAISEALSHNAKKLVALMRICSLTPYWVLNCICGITDMSTCDYMIGTLPTFIADVPYIYVCASISDVSKISSSNPLGAWYYVLLAIGFVFLFAIEYYYSNYL